MRRLLPLLLLLPLGCTDVTISDGNTAPTVAIVGPNDGLVRELGEDVTFVGSVSDTGSPAGDLDVTWTSSSDGLVHSENPDDSGVVGFTTDALTAGEHTVTLRAEDPDGLSAADAVGVIIEEPEAENTRPDCAITAPADDSEHEELDTLFLEGTASDLETEAADLVATWASSEDGALGSVSPSTSGAILLQVDELTPGFHVLTLDVSDPDGLNCSEFITIEVLAANTAPSVAAPTVSPDPLFTNDTASCAVPTAVDPDGDSVTVALQWFVGGLDTGETGATLSGTFFDKGEAVRCTATPSDPLVSGAPSDSADVVVSDTPPTAPGAAIAPASPTEGLNALVCSVDTPSLDADGDAITYAFAWSLDGNPWVGATSMTTWAGDTIAAADVAAGTWICVVTPTADSVLGPAGSDSVVVAPANQPPSVGAPTITPTPLLTGNDALCTSATPTDPEGDAVTLAYAWTVGGAPAGGNSDTLSMAAFSKGELVECEVTPSDAAGSGTPASASLTVGDTPPGGPGVDIAPAAPSASVDDLHCQVTTPSVDADGDAITYSFAWTVDASPWLGATSTTTWPGDTIEAANVTDGTWACSVIPTADAVDGPVGNASVAVGPAPGDSLLVFVSSTPHDGDFGGLSGVDQWCAGLAHSAGHRGLFLAWLSDPTGSPATRFTPGPNNAYAMVDGTVVADNWADLTDGDIDAAITLDEEGGVPSPSVLYSFTQTDGTAGLFGDANEDCYGADCHCNHWSDNSVAAPNGSAVARNGFTNGQWTDYSFGNSCGSPAHVFCFEQYVAAPNDPPTAAPVISPTPLYGSTQATCTPNTADPEGDAVTVSYSWTVGGLPAGGDSPTLAAAEFSGGETVRCIVTPSDAYGPGADATATVVVADSAPTQPAVDVTPASSNEGASDLWCEVTAASVDIDGDSFTYTFDWTFNGQPWFGATTTTAFPGDTIPAASTVAGTWACSVAAVNAQTSPAGADSATVSLAPIGKQVFVTSIGHTGNFGGVTGADQFCMDRAAAGGLAGTFKAWISGSAFSSSPASRFARSSIPYVRVDGVQVAADWADLTDGTIDAPITVNEFGVVGHSQFYFSFTQTDGSPGLFFSFSSNCYGDDCHCDEWTTASNATPNGSAVARPGYTNDDWTDYSFINACGNDYSVMCFEQ